MKKILFLLVVLTLFSGNMLAGNICNAFCSYSGRVLKCEGRNITSLYGLGSTNGCYSGVKTIIIDNKNSSGTITNFSYLKNVKGTLQNLTITRSNLTTALNTATLSELKNLRYLNLSRNKIKKTDTFDETTGLIKLDLSYNQIETLGALTNVRFFTVGDENRGEIEDVCPGFDYMSEMEKASCVREEMSSEEIQQFSADQLCPVNTTIVYPGEDDGEYDNESLCPLFDIRTLRWLNLTGNYISLTDGGYDLFKENFKNITIINYGSSSVETIDVHENYLKIFGKGEQKRKSYTAPRWSVGGRVYVPLRY